MRDFTTAKPGRSNGVRYSDGKDRSIWRQGGTRAWRNNNPGNIRGGDFAKRHGAIGEAGGFAVFPDTATGRKALGSLLDSKTYQGLNVGEAIKRYAPPNENDTGQYIKNIESMSGIKADRPMSSLTPEEKESMIDTIQHIEGWKEGETVPEPPEKPSPGGNGKDGGSGNGSSGGDSGNGSGKKSDGGGSAPSEKTSASDRGDIMDRPVRDIDESEIHDIMGSSAYRNPADPSYPLAQQKVADWHAYHYGNETVQQDATGKMIKPVLKTQRGKSGGDIHVRAHERSGGKIHVHAYDRSRPKK